MTHPKWVNYIDQGYSPNDGLGPGRWMRDTWGVRVWVPAEPPPTPKDNRCECGQKIGKGSVRCRPCNLEVVKQKRPMDPLKLVACPTCGAKVGQSCRTKNGNRAGSHKDRLTPRLCECGSVATPNCTMCDPCREQSRKDTWRTAAERYRNRVKEEAA
jgi:hypothetical protein